MKKTLFSTTIAALCAATMLLSACGSSGTPAPAAATPAPAAETATTGTEPAAEPAATGLSGDITFAIWDGNQQEGMQALVDAYTAQNPDVNITISLTPWDQYWQVLSAAADGAMPDVFWMHSNNFVDFAKKGVLMDCTGLFDPANYPEGISEIFKWDGKQLGVPKDFDTIALAYNKTIFDAAGVAYPDETWDWDKLVEVAQQLTTDTVYGFCAPAGEDQCGYLLPIYQAGGYTVKLGDKTAGYTDPKTIEGLQFWMDLQNKYKVSPTQQQFASMTFQDYFKSGQAAMTFLGSWDAKGYMSAMEELGQGFDIAVMPKGPTGIQATIYNGLTYAGYKDSAHPDIVKSFLQFLGSKEAAIIMGESGAAIPAYTGTQDSWYNQFPGYNVKVYPDMIAYGVQYPFSATKAQWGDIEKNTVASLYAEDAPDIATAMDGLETEVNALLATE